MKNKDTEVVTMDHNLDYSDNTSLITTSNDLLIKSRWPRLQINEQLSFLIYKT